MRGIWWRGGGGAAYAGLCLLITATGWRAERYPAYFRQTANAACARAAAWAAESSAAAMLFGVKASASVLPGDLWTTSLASGKGGMVRRQAMADAMK